ncbi:MAG: hypothetical protein U1E33_06860 [Rhodospirillales bacterium]
MRRLRHAADLPLSRQRLDRRHHRLAGPAGTGAAEHQYGTESRLAWFATMPHLPAASTAESMQAERQRRLVCYQHPDHDTADGCWPPITTTC